MGLLSFTLEHGKGQYFAHFIWWNYQRGYIFYFPYASVPVSFFLSLSQFLSLFIVMCRSSRTVNRNSAPALSPFHDWFILSHRSLTLLPFTTSALRNTCLFLSLRNHGTERSYSNITLPERITTSAYLGIKQKYTDRSAGPRQFLLRSRVYIHRCFLHLPSPILIESMFTRCLSATTPSELIRSDASIRSNWEFPWQVKRPLEIPPFTISSFVPWSPEEGTFRSTCRSCVRIWSNPELACVQKMRSQTI